ncbi:MAG: tyrosine--tRNA ligase [Nitrososphaerota archaeon]|nr:tyrosine--tRNA ligase [Nitrososphaerota archaeon]
MASKLEILKASPTEELLQEDEFAGLMEREKNPRMYVGFEISGQVHLGTGIVSMAKVRDFQRAGFDCTIFLADWHSMLNGKLDGDLQTIREVAGGYFKAALGIGLKSAGGTPESIRFVMGSEIYDQAYWALLVNVCKNLTVKRVQRMITIMGRKEGEATNFAQLVYPPMQIADIFQLQVHVAQGGMDQRKAHVGAREVADKLGVPKPLALHHHLLLGLTGVGHLPSASVDSAEFKAELKMSKSKPNSAIFIHDSPEEIEKKLMGAYCPEKEVEFNPVIDILEHVVLPVKHKLKIERPSKYGGDLDIVDAAELKSLYIRGDLHPLDLKRATTRGLVELLLPARDYFERHADLLSIFARIKSSQ